MTKTQKRLVVIIPVVLCIGFWGLFFLFNRETPSEVVSQLQKPADAAARLPEPLLPVADGIPVPPQAHAVNTSENDSLTAEETTDAALAESPRKLSADEARKLLEDRGTMLCPHPLWSRLMAQTDALERLVMAVDKIAAGELPLPALDFLYPSEAFSAVAGEGVGILLASPAAQRRFQPLVDAFCSWNNQEAVSLFHDLEPTLDAALWKLGYPESESFRQRLADAAQVLLETPQWDGEPPVEHIFKNLFKYIDPELEELLPVQKLMLRMGQKNRENVRQKLQMLSTELGLFQASTNEHGK